MKNLRTAFFPVLLSTAALVGCAPNEQDDLNGMTGAVQGQCVDRATDNEKWACVSVADEQATFLAKYVGTKGEFDKVCDFSRPPEAEGSINEVTRANAHRITKCLDAIDQHASAGVKTVSREIRAGLQRGL